VPEPTNLLRRSCGNCWIAWVCGGIAEWRGWNRIVVCVLSGFNRASWISRCSFYDTLAQYQPLDGRPAAVKRWS